MALGSVATSWPRMLARPPDRGTSPRSPLMRLDLPAPLAPNSPVDPGGNVAEMALTAVLVP